MTHKMEVMRDLIREEDFPGVVRIDARSMREAGHVFFVTPNGVWLTDSVPSAYLSGWDVE